MNCSPLKLILKDLIRNNPVEEKTLKKNTTVYVATPKARKTLSYFKELREMVPIVE